MRLTPLLSAKKKSTTETKLNEPNVRKRPLRVKKSVLRKRPEILRSLRLSVSRKETCLTKDLSPSANT